jgi:hypothetical protein
MPGTLDLVPRGLTGTETREDALYLDPFPDPFPLPALSEYGFPLCGAGGPGRDRGTWEDGTLVLKADDPSQ